MFSDVSDEIDDRFRLLRHSFALSPRSPREPSALVKGLVFVQLYAIYEYTVRSCCGEVILAVNSANCSLDRLRPSLLTIYLNPEFDSLRGCGQKEIWNKRLQLIERVMSQNTAFAARSLLPNVGKHHRSADLQFLFTILGISRLPVRRRRHLFRIDEIVDRRNDIAHGLVTADKIGRDFTRADIHHRINQMESVCRCLIASMERHCSSPTNFVR